MNRGLADIFTFLNAFFALILMIGGAGCGHILIGGEGEGVFFGLLVGGFIAAVLCGFFSVVISCREELLIIRSLLEKNLATVKFQNTINNKGAEVLIKWANKDLNNI